MFYGILIVFMIFGLVPICIGLLLTNKMKEPIFDSLAFCYVSGFITMLAIVQVISVPMTLLKIPFNILVVVYTTILILLLFLSICLSKRRLCNKVLEVLKGFRQKNFSIMTIAIVLVLLQMLFAVIFMVPNGDDAAYIAYANDMIHKNTVFLHSPYTGELVGVGVNKMTLTSWCVFIAIVAKITGMHVTIVAHTIIPFFFVAIAYITYYWIGKSLLLDNKKMGLYVIILSLLNIWSGFSIYTLTFRLLQCQWQGKAVVASIIIPIVIFYSRIVLNEKISRNNVLLLIIFGIASCGSTLLGGGLFVIIVLGVAMINYHKIKKVSILVTGVLVCIPPGLYATLFLFQYYLTAKIGG